MRDSWCHCGRHLSFLSFSSFLSLSPPSPSYLFPPTGFKVINHSSYSPRPCTYNTSLSNSLAFRLPITRFVTPSVTPFPPRMEQLNKVGCSFSLGCSYCPLGLGLIVFSPLFPLPNPYQVLKFYKQPSLRFHFQQVASSLSLHTKIKPE